MPTAPRRTRDDSDARPRDAADTSGTHARIHAIVRRIPQGRVATYGQVARLAGLPNHARLVGYALAALHDSTTVPWHRVVNAEGRVSLRRAASDGATLQRIRLEAEGVTFRGGRVPLAEFGWRPRTRGGRQSTD